MVPIFNGASSTLGITLEAARHSWKQEIISHIFSQKSVVEFEPSLRLYVGQRISHREHLFNGAVKGDGGWSGRDVPYTSSRCQSPRLLCTLRLSPSSQSSEEGLAAIGQKIARAFVKIPAIQIRNSQIEATLAIEFNEQLNDKLVSTVDKMKNYLDVCINEGLRLYSTSALGLPRIVHEGWMTVHGHFSTRGMRRAQSRFIGVSGYRFVQR
ncbi:hypothetical protein EV421DRAFT_1732602 [Armillaria borealis]|uniref:Uncharacterized protein n=1 Tax=Armillaria borealis TaxID=47425 RepID=A0AA39MWM0_9AGAR|nr:hypothetical protein EV421DRAFT_1732602 [Armillaria borealis]